MAAQSTYPSERAKKFVLRLPPGIRGRLSTAADAANRSMNSEVVTRLRDSFRRVPVLARSHQEPEPKENTEQLMLRLSDDLTEEVAVAIQRSGRSKNAEIVIRLVESLEYGKVEAAGEPETPPYAGPADDIERELLRLIQGMPSKKKKALLEFLRLET